MRVWVSVGVVLAVLVAAGGVAASLGYEWPWAPREDFTILAGDVYCARHFQVQKRIWDLEAEAKRYLKRGQQVPVDLLKALSIARAGLRYYADKTRGRKCF